MDLLGRAAVPYLVAQGCGQGVTVGAQGAVRGGACLPVTGLV